MTPFRTFGLSLLAAGTLVACDASEDAVQDGDAVETSTESLVQSDDTIGDRYRPIPDGLVTFQPVLASAKSSLQLAPLYNVVPPTDGSEASHLTFQDGGLVASYLTRGNAFAGGFDVIDRADPAESSGFTSDLIDFSEVFELDGVIFLSGSLDIERPEVSGLNFETKAVFARVNPGDPEVYVNDLSSDFVMDAAYPGEGDLIYLVTGIDGALHSYDRISRQKKTIVSAYDLRSVVHVEDGNKDVLFVLDGEGNVYRMRTNKKNLGQPVHTSAPSPIGAIAKIHVGADERVYVPSGVLGFDVLDTDGDYITHLESGAVKSIATSGAFVFVANADDGVLVAEWSPDGTALNVVGQIDFGAASVNHVEVDGDTLYVAAGSDGLYAIQVGTGAE